MAGERQSELLLKSTRVPVIEYTSSPHEDLPIRERLALTQFQEAVRASGKVYVIQKSIPFYPSHVSKKRIEEAARTNPRIFDPYTFVYDAGNNDFATIPYHTHPQLRPYIESAARFLQEGARLTQDPILRECAAMRRQNLLDGNYEQSEAYWLESRDETEIDFFAGPYDRYLDGAYNKKFAYGGAVGRLNRVETARRQGLVNQALDAWQKSGISQFAIVRPRVRIRADDTVTVAGLPADINMTADSLPCPPEWRVIHGNKIYLMLPTLIDKFNRVTRPIVREVIAVNRRMGITDDSLIEANTNLLVYHETMHTVIRRPGDEERLRDEYSFMNELSASVTGLALIQETGMPKRMLDAALAMQLAIIANEYKAYTAGSKGREAYLKGGLVILNYLHTNHLIYIDSSGINWNITANVYKGFRDLAVALDRIITYDDVNMARRLFDQYGSDEVIKSLVTAGKRPKSEPPAEDAKLWRNGRDSTAPNTA